MAEYQQLRDLNNFLLAASHLINARCLRKEYQAGAAAAFHVEEILTADQTTIFDPTLLLRFYCVASECAAQTRQADAGIRYLLAAESLAEDHITLGAISQSLGACFNMIGKRL